MSREENQYMKIATTPETLDVFGRNVAAVVTQL